MTRHEPLHEAIQEADGLVAQADLARRWGLSRQRVWQLVREPAFPTPAGTVAGAPVWIATEADQWRRHRSLHLARGKIADLLPPGRGLSSTRPR